MNITSYVHHGQEVFVREDLRGTHREYCLCHSCGRFTPDSRRSSCRTANRLYDLCCRANIVAPVFECPDFTPREDQHT